MRSHTRAPAAAFALALGLAGCERVPLADAGSPLLPSIINRAELAETSGLAASRLQPGRLWLLDDSGNPARLFALSPGGRDLGTWPVPGAAKVDWEDIASYRDGSGSWLLVADTGDNGGVRKTLSVLVLAEPAADANPAPLEITRRIEFRWPDGPRDCEAMAVDVAGDQILLMTKKRSPPQLYALPLHPKTKGVQTAQFLNLVPGIPQPGAQEKADSPVLAKLGPQVSAMDLSADGATLAVLTYRHILLYSRPAGPSGWAGPLAPPRELTMPLIPQPEALGFSQDGRRLYLSGEMSPTLLYALPVPGP